ncbi:hypothetical protein Syun_028375 [Stephania yunnanensis]|uniref:Phospholipid/glycerol acyltransferase domain-containing protein n=1 Tax=Stephania yunnanensis TaxID=152371 RepID=A0AAP0HNR5_9MAGN
MVFFKLGEWLFLGHSCYKIGRKIKSFGKLFFNPNSSFIRSSSSSSQQLVSSFPSVSKLYYNVLESKKSETCGTIVLCDIFGSLLRSQSMFPYFMLVAFEGGNILRALLLLLSCPILFVLDHSLGLKVMVFITFCGLKLRDMESVGRAVLPKFYLEDLNLQAYEVVASSKKKVVFTSAPRVLVEWFLKEYLSVDDVVGTDLHTFKGYFTGFVQGSSSSGLLVKHKALKEYFGDNKRADIGLGTSSLSDHLFLSLCKEAYVVSKEELKNREATVMPREKYPKPLIFHDGRLAFLPTPFATLCMFLWIPLAFPLAIFRILVGILLPYKISPILGQWSGLNIRIKGRHPHKNTKNNQRKGVLYVCNHRTLLDPVFLCLTLGQSLTAVTYSLSKMSELIAPIRTVRLTRDRNKDGESMQRLLSEGDLVVCPEGTTCREPYLLRFSSLFAELADEIVPVAMNTHVTMFYGTTASGLKCLDPIIFFMNPRPCYVVEFLERVPREMTCSGGGKSSCEVANYIQKRLAGALGFECTNFTRRDKYMMLAGNEGVVNDCKKS